MSRGSLQQTWSGVSGVEAATSVTYPQTWSGVSGVEAWESSRKQKQLFEVERLINSVVVSTPDDISSVLPDDTSPVLPDDISPVLPDDMSPAQLS
eukprot:1562815-Pyramimonas_sp.AAC.1